MDLYREPQDKRMRRTRKAIKEAYIDLVVEKGPNSISVTELAERADINRKTFYAHYQTTADVLDDIENETVHYISSIFNEIDFDKMGYNPYPLFERLNHLLSAERDLFTFLEKTRTVGHIAQKMDEIIRARLMEAMQKKEHLSDVETQIILDFQAAGIFAVYLRWHNSDRSTSLKEVAEVISRILRFGVHGEGAKE